MPFLTKLGLAPSGLSMEFAEQKLDDAAQQGDENAQRFLGQATKHAVLSRVERNADLLGRARVLWVDDHPENNRPIVDLLEHFGTVVDTPQTNDDALALMRTSRFDVVISDVARDLEGHASSLKGIELAEEVFKGWGQKTILFTARFEPTTLPGASIAERLDLQHRVNSVVAGRTNHFDEALHLILDQHERNLL
jgi:CheY-like chemotaxis protein